MADSHKVNYTAIFFALCVCTGLSVLADLGKGNMGWSVMVGVVMAIAIVKATFVLLYFMHIRFETAWKYILLAPTIILALTLPLALSPDVGFHYYLVQVPQTLVPVVDLHHGSGTGHGAAHSEGHAAGEHASDKQTEAAKDHAPAKGH